MNQAWDVWDSEFSFEQSEESVRAELRIPCYHEVKLNHFMIALLQGYDRQVSMVLSLFCPLKNEWMNKLVLASLLISAINDPV